MWYKAGQYCGFVLTKASTIILIHAGLKLTFARQMLLFSPPHCFNTIPSPVSTISWCIPIWPRKIKCAVQILAWGTLLISRELCQKISCKKSVTYFECKTDFLPCPSMLRNKLHRQLRVSMWNLFSLPTFPQDSTVRQVIPVTWNISNGAERVCIWPLFITLYCRLYAEAFPITSQHNLLSRPCSLKRNMSLCISASEREFLIRWEKVLRNSDSTWWLKHLTWLIKTLIKLKINCQINSGSKS